MPIQDGLISLSCEQQEMADQNLCILSQPHVNLTSVKTA